MTDSSPRIIREVVQKNIREFISNFNPDDRSKSTQIYRIPEHQRYAKWNPDEKELLVDSVFNNFPFHQVILRERVDEKSLSVYYDIEDGQSRLTVLHCFANDQFTWQGNFFSDLSQQLKDNFNNYHFSVEVIRQATDKDAEAIFDRLNHGKKLDARDYYWIYKDVSMVKFTIDFFNGEKHFEEFVGSKFSSTTQGRAGLDAFTCITLAVALCDDSRLTNNFRANCKFLENLLPEGKENVIKFWAFFFEVAQAAVVDFPKKPNGHADIKRKIGKKSFKFFLPMVIDWNRCAIGNEISIHTRKDLWTWYTKFHFSEGASKFDDIIYKDIKGSVYSSNTRVERLLKIEDYFSNLVVLF